MRDNIVQHTLVQHTAYERGWSRLSQCFEWAEESAEPICMAVLGESRTGKTRLLEEFEHEHQARRTQDGRVVPVLRVKAPAKPTAKGLAEVMLEKIGDPIWHKGSETVKTTRLRRLLREASTRMLIVDEFQHFRDKASDKVAHHVTDWLKILVDDEHVALVVAGLPICRSIISQNEQLAGRFLSEVIMPRFDWTDSDERAEFVGILAAFQEEIGRRFDLPHFDDEDMAFRFYCATGGLMGYLTKCLQQAVWDAADEGRPHISLEHLRAAHDKAIWGQVRLDGLPSPFDRHFVARPSAELILRVRTIGSRQRETSKEPRRRKAKGASVAQVLAAR